MVEWLNQTLNRRVFVCETAYTPEVSSNLRTYKSVHKFTKLHGSFYRANVIPCQTFND